MDAGAAVCKDQGKSKIFWAAPDAAGGLSREEEAQLDAEIRQASQELAAQQQAIARLQASIKAAAKVRSLSEVQAEAKAARSKAEAAEAALAEQRKELGADGGGGLGAAEEAKVRKEYIRLRKAYLDRRRTCMEMLGNISEGTGKSEKKLMEEIGMETDAEVGVDKAQFPPIF